MLYSKVSAGTPPTSSSVGDNQEFGGTLFTPKQTLPPSIFPSVTARDPYAAANK